MREGFCVCRRIFSCIPFLRCATYDGEVMAAAVVAATSPCWRVIHTVYDGTVRRGGLAAYRELVRPQPARCTASDGGDRVPSPPPFHPIVVEPRPTALARTRAFVSLPWSEPRVTLATAAARARPAKLAPPVPGQRTSVLAVRHYWTPRPAPVTRSYVTRAAPFVWCKSTARPSFIPNSSPETLLQFCCHVRCTVDASPRSAPVPCRQKSCLPKLGLLGRTPYPSFPPSVSRFPTTRTAVPAVLFVAGPRRRPFAHHTPTCKNTWFLFMYVLAWVFFFIVVSVIVITTWSSILLLLMCKNCINIDIIIIIIAATALFNIIVADVPYFIGSLSRYHECIVRRTAYIVYADANYGYVNLLSRRIIFTFEFWVLALG